MLSNKLKAIGTALLTSFLFFGTAIAQERIGQIDVEEGQALVIRGTQTRQVNAGNTAAVFAQDTLQTLGESAATVTLGTEDDGDLFTLGEDTTFVVEEYVVENEKPTRGFFSLLGGKVRSLIGSLKGQKDIKIQTSTATIGVKGTDFLTEVPTSELTQVTTFEGVVTLENRLGDVLKEVSLSQGFSSLVVADATPSSPFAMSRESLLEASRSISRSVPVQTVENNISQIIRDNSLSSFQKEQFDNLVENAARTQGGLVRVTITFH